MPGRKRKNAGDTWPPTLRSLEAQLAAAEDNGAAPIDPTAPAILPPNPVAHDICVDLGTLDSERPGTDVHGENPQPPSAEVVRSHSRSPVIALGHRFQQVKTAWAAGAFGRVQPVPVQRWKILASLWPIIMVMVIVGGAGILTEIVYGQHAAALLTAATPQAALNAAIAFTIVFNGAAFFGAHMAYDAYPAIVHRHGVHALLAVLVLIAAVAAGLGLVVGGFDPIQLNGVTGGDPATVTAPRPDTRPLLAATYFGIILLITVAIAAGHVLVLHLLDVRVVNATKTALARATSASLGWTEARDLAVAVAQSYLDAVPDAHEQGRARVGARNAAFIRHSSPEISEMFDNVVYDDHEPLWAQEARQFIADLQAEQAPQPNLTQIA